jgi:hypothetical protein
MRMATAKLSRRMSAVHLSRRQVMTGGAVGLGLLGLGAATAATIAEATRPDRIRSLTVAYTEAGVRRGLAAPEVSMLPAYSRVMPELTDPAPARRQHEFLGRCSQWLDSLPAHRRELAVSALLDLWVLSDELPAAVASWAGYWRYIWPRDAAFASVALARVGAADLAWSHLLYLQTLQDEDGSFSARVIPETGLPPDDRESQFDSLGLVLWAVAEVHSSAFASDVPVDLTDMDHLLARTADRLYELTDHGRSLPPAGPDYWEVGESRVTLGLAGPTLIGLDALAALSSRDANLADRLGGGADTIVTVADAYATTFARTFGANGMQRYPTSGGCDSAAAYLALSATEPRNGAAASEHGRSGAATRTRLYELEAEVLGNVWDRLEQPAGGIKPGHGWLGDGTSWTPSTSLMGLGFARLGMVNRADAVLDWLAENRTEAGSLPEKVSADGSPASVAPLAWTAANVIITLDELRRRDESSGE